MLKFLKYSALSLFALIATGALALMLSGYGYILTGISRTYLIGHATANIDDHAQFETHTIKAATPNPWAKHANYNATPLPAALTAYLDKYETAAFMVIKDGQVLSEHYLNGYDERSKTNSFSMAKSVVTMLLDIAIQEGHVESLNQPLTDFLPEFKDDKNAKTATIGQLSLMTSGFDWEEAYYSPFSPTVELVYSQDIAKFLFSRSFSDVPGERFYYSSASTQLLAIALTRAIRQKYPEMSLADYLSEKLWKPLGMNDDALWHTDGQGLELAYCCISSNARNFAKFGQLLLNDGQWQGKQLLSKDFAIAMRTPQRVGSYGYSLWINQANTPPFYQLQGHLGQYVTVIPSENMLVVRLGRQRDRTTDSLNGIVPIYVKHAMAIAESSAKAVSQ